MQSRMSQLGASAPVYVLTPVMRDWSLYLPTWLQQNPLTGTPSFTKHPPHMTRGYATPWYQPCPAPPLALGTWCHPDAKVLIRVRRRRGIDA